MTFATRLGLCGVVLCCLLFVFNIQSAKGRVLELRNGLQIREVSIPAEQNVEIVKAVVSAAKWLKLSVLHTGSPLDLTVGSSFLHNNLWKKSKSYQPSEKSEARVCVGSFDCEKESIDLRKHTNDVHPFRQIQKTLKIKEYEEKLILNPQLLPNGPTPPSGPNPGHNAIILAEENVNGKDINSLPKGPTPSSGPNPPHNLVIDRQTQKLGQLHVESKPKLGSTASPSGPSLGHNDQILTDRMTSNNMLLQKQASGAIQQLEEDGESVAEKTSSGSNPTMPSGLALNQLPKGIKPPSSPNTKHSKPSDINHDQMHYTTPSTDSQKPANDDQREICEPFSDSTQNLSELVGCQQDIHVPLFSMNDPSASATRFRTNAAMQQNMHNLFAAGIAKGMPSRP